VESGEGRKSRKEAKAEKKGEIQYIHTYETR
jgi:hypothetical protein